MADSVNLSNIKATTIEGSKALIQNEMAIDYAQLQAAAREFLIQLDIIYNSGEKVRTHSSGENELMRLWSVYRDAETAQALALIQNKFALALDSFLQRKIILTYVTKQGELILYTEEGEQEILEQVTKNTGRANFRASAWEDKGTIGKVPERYKTFALGERDLIKEINDATESRKQVYQTAITRYEKVQEGKIHTKLRKRYYMRLTKPNLMHFPDRPFSRGQMVEAYANAVTQKEKNISNSDIEHGLEYLYKHYIKGHKDNIAAILTGDVKISDDGKVSLAVKGQSASTAKIGQYIIAALAIQDQPPMTIEETEQWLKELKNLSRIGSYAKKVESKGYATLEEYLSQQVSKWISK